jgi:hypothetical protein
MGNTGPTRGGPRFFQAESMGQAVVYVIDRSNSMALSGGLEAARRELLASLDRLPESARFQVILYNRAAEPLCIGGQTGLVEVTTTNKQEVAALLKEFPAEGGTDHLKALKKALSLGPDTVFFLTDADDLTDRLVGEVTRINHVHNRDGAAIHVIELNDANRDRPEMPLHVLARLNRGSYQAFRLDADR